MLWLHTIGFLLFGVAGQDVQNLSSTEEIVDAYQTGLRRLTMNAKSTECKQKIADEHYKYFRALCDETPQPFEHEFFHTQCSTAFDRHEAKMPNYLKIKPAAPDYPIAPARDLANIPVDKMAILYIMLVHNNSQFVERIINSLNEPQHTFIIHVDLKAAAVRTELISTAALKPNVFLVEEEDSLRVNWGGYSAVNATIQGMKYAIKLGRPFHYMQLLSGTSYPIKSNLAIRTELAQQSGAIYMDVFEEPSVPHETVWFHYVECDDRLHRINKLSIIRGMHMYVGSQWFTIPHHVVLWLLNDPLPQQYQSYAQHVVVADENYFATLISNSPYCADIVRKKNLFLLFDKWENELSTVHLRDQRKCLSPDPDHCGRSPSTLTSKFKNLLEVSHALFARKFDPNDKESLSLLSTIESWRNHNLLEPRSSTFGDIGKKMMIRFSGLRQDDHQVTVTNAGDSSITDNSTIRDKNFAEVGTDNTGDDANLRKSRGHYARQEITDFCWEMGNKGEPITLNLCNASEPAQWFILGPCTRNSNVTINDGGCPLIQRDQDEMYCQLQSGFNNACVDLSGESPFPGSKLIAWDCAGQWNQLFRLQTDCAISLVLPEVIGLVRGYESQNITLCFEAQRSSKLSIDGDHVANIVAAYCPAPIHPLVQTFLNRNATPNAAERLAQNSRKFQSYNYLMEDGEDYKLYGFMPPNFSEESTDVVSGFEPETREEVYRLNDNGMI